MGDFNLPNVNWGNYTTQTGDQWSHNLIQKIRELNLPTLAYRRVRGDMIEVFEIVDGGYDEEVCGELFE